MIGAIHAVLKKPILYLKEQLPPGQFFVLASALVGLTSGLAGVTLKYCVHSIERLVTYYSNVFEEFFVLLVRERYAVRIATAEGEKNAVVSEKKEYITQIVDALNEAFTLSRPPSVYEKDLVGN